KTIDREKGGEDAVEGVVEEEEDEHEEDEHSELPVDDEEKKTVIKKEEEKESESTAEPEAPGSKPSSEVVDGQEVFSTCDACLARAKVLSNTINFEATMKYTVNMGFYKSSSEP